MNKDYNIDEIVSGIDFLANQFHEINGLMLTNREIEILDRYKINYKKCSSLKEILFELEEILNDIDVVDEELDYISATISERDYYQNTNK